MNKVLDESLVTIARGAGIIFIGLIIGNILGIINQVLLGRFLGVEKYGLFNLSYSIITLASTLAVFGLFNALPRFIPFHLEKNERNIVKSTIRFSTIFVFISSTIIGLIIFFFSNYIAISIFHEDKLGVIITIFLIGLPILSVNSIFQAILQGFKSVSYQVLLNEIILRIIKMIIFISFIILGYVLYGAIIALLLATFIVIIASYIVLRKKVFLDSSKLKTVPVAKSLLSFAWPLSLSGLTFLFVSKTDIILLGYFRTSSDVGIYTPAIVIALFLTFIGSSFGYIFLPVVSGLFAKKKHQEIESMFKSSSKWMFILVLPLLIFIVLFPKEIITQLYGINYAEGYIALIILAIGISSNMLTGMTGNILIAGGKPKYNLTCEIIAAITNITFNVALIPKYGILGAAIGTSISFFARNIASLIFVYNSQRIHPYNLKYLRVFGSGIIIFLIFYFIKTNIFVNTSSIIYLIISGPILLLIYFVLIFMSHSLDRNDFFILNIIYKRIGIKFKLLEKIIKIYISK